MLICSIVQDLPNVTRTLIELDITSTIKRVNQLWEKGKCGWSHYELKEACNLGVAVQWEKLLILSSFLLMLNNLVGMLKLLVWINNVPMNETHYSQSVLIVIEFHILWKGTGCKVYGNPQWKAMYTRTSCYFMLGDAHCLIEEVCTHGELHQPFWWSSQEIFKCAAHYMHAGVPISMQE